jgi:hypothetical protein
MTPSAPVFACIVFLVAFGAALLGMFLHTRLPDHHVSARSQDVIKLVMGLIATISALVLSLLIASAKSSYDTQSNGMMSLSIDIIALDRTLEQYGPDADPARMILRGVVRTVYDRVWSGKAVDTRGLDPTIIRPQADHFLNTLLRLEPRDDSQRFLKNRALGLTGQVGRLRLLLYEESGSSIAWPFVTVLVFWIGALFLGFGLMTRANTTVLTALLIGSASVSGAMFLIVELDQPFDGLIKISPTPLLGALTLIGG